MEGTTGPAAAEGAGTQSTDTSTTTNESAYGQEPNQVSKLFERLRKKLGDDGLGGESREEPAAAQPDGRLSEEPEGDKPAGEAKPEGEKPEGKKEEPKSEVKADEGGRLKEEHPEEHKLTLRLARLENDFAKSKAQALTEKKRADTAEASFADLKARAKANPLRTMEELYGEPFPKIIERAKAGDFDDQVSKLPKEVQDLIARAKERDEREEAERKRSEEETQKRAAAEKRERDMAADRPKVQKFLEVKGEEYPLLASLSDASEELLEAVYVRFDKGEKPDLRTLAKELEETAKKNFTEFFTTKKLVAALAQDPQVFSVLKEALGLAEQNSKSPPRGTQGNETSPEAPQPPRTVATAVEIPTRVDKPLTEEEERQESIRLLRQGRESGRFQL